MVPERYRLGEAFVPKGRYLDPEFQQLELDRLFTKTWLMACRLEELPGVGSYVEYLIGGHSILVVRESTDSIRGYFNACRHRGTRLATGRGRVGALICPFHGWRWNLDGSIRLVLDPEEFAPRSDDDLGLQPVQVDTWGGFVFINMDLEAEPLLDYLDPIPSVFEPFHVENMRYRWMKGVIAAVQLEDRARRIPRGVPRARHAPAAHPMGQAQPQHRHAEGTRPAGLVAHGHVRQVRPLRQPRPEEERRIRIFESAKGPITRPTSRSSARTRRTSTSRGRSDERRSIADAVQYIANDMQALETERSIRVAGDSSAPPTFPTGMSAGQYYLETAPRGGDRRRARLAGDHTARQWAAAGTAWHVFPNTILLPEPGLHHRLPGPAERQGSRQLPVRDVLPRADPGRRLRQEDTDFAPEYFDDYRDANLGEVLTQDLDNSENVTIGMHSPSFDGHRLSQKQEMTIYNHHRAADRYLWTD